jgi:3-hydroxyisobutyrate dehydrogenase-like beta-hydroxyacid dehydrogenase
MTAAVIGLGQMGSGIAARLIDAGYLSDGLEPRSCQNRVARSACGIVGNHPGGSCGARRRRFDNAL